MLSIKTINIISSIILSAVWVGSIVVLKNLDGAINKQTVLLDSLEIENTRLYNELKKLESQRVEFTTGLSNMFDEEYIGGRVYKTVRYGNQVWMAENLDYDITGSFCHKDSGCYAFGRFYSWSAALEASNEIEGWHLPSDEEWKEMELALGMNEFEVAKNSELRKTTLSSRLRSKKGWEKPEHPGDNSLGFNVKGAGHYSEYNFSIDTGEYAFFWTSSEAPKTDYAWGRIFFVDDGDHEGFGRGNYYHKKGFSVRLVKDR